MSAENILQTVVGKVGEFYEWLADRLNDDAARAEVLIDLGLPPTIAVGQPFPQHQIKGINEYRKTISIETEVSAGHAQDLGKMLCSWANQSIQSHARFVALTRWNDTPKVPSWLESRPVL